MNSIQTIVISCLSARRCAQYNRRGEVCRSTKLANAEQSNRTSGYNEAADALRGRKC
jgi:hypothetical protein